MDRFSSSGGSSVSLVWPTSPPAPSPGMGIESSCRLCMIVRSPSRTSAAEAKRIDGCFSKQRRTRLSNSPGKSGAISFSDGGSAYWIARMLWNSGASGR